MLERETHLPLKLAAAVAAGVVLVFGALGLTDTWRTVELKGFDALSVATAPQRSSLPITIVGIDEASFAQIAQQWPWPRGLHGKLIDQLDKSGALVIAFDLLLAEPDRSGAAEDRALAEAIARSGKVVVASDMAYQESAHARQWLRVDPLDEFKVAGATNGLANVGLDPDLVVRQMPLGRDVFWRELVRRAAERQPGIAAVEPAADSMIRYAGADHTFPYVSYYQALNADTHLPPDAFRDQIVLIGRDVKASPDARAANADLFATPFTASTGWLTPGVEVHASILETAILGNAIVPAPQPWSLALLAAAALVSGAIMRRWRPVFSALAGIVIVAAIAVLDWLLFVRFHLWLPALGAAMGVAAIYISYGALAFLAERQRKAEMRRAFSLYVSPEVVDHVMARPEGLTLGGERRDVTMLFTDLKGFTTFTEQLQPEEVTRILNQHFSRATAIIKSHHGTVNRFIGDAVMAMWGAPLDDPKQALNACRAACEMQEDMARLRTELVAQGLPEIWMRVGIHSCNAIIGNLGSSDRFDYTAIGDGVNLAARLEGVNKLYGTGILLSGTTVEKCGAEMPVRVVDRVIVKGKSAPVEIFTPCQDAAVIDASARAMAAYRARRWEESERCWRQVLDRLPGDSVALLHLERVSQCKSLPPDPAWKDVVELEKL